MKIVVIILELIIYVVGTICYLALIYDPILYLFGKKDPYYTPWSDMFEALAAVFAIWALKMVLKLVLEIFL